MNDRVEMFYGASPKLFEFAKELRTNETEAEKLLWKMLCRKQIAGIRFRRQHPILYFIADFYCHKAKLIVEVDGGVHRLPEQYEYDRNRDYELKELGLTVLRFTNEEVMSDMESVIKKIREAVMQKVNAPKIP